MSLLHKRLFLDIEFIFLKSEELITLNQTNIQKFSFNTTALYENINIVYDEIINHIYFNYHFLEKKKTLCIYYCHKRNVEFIFKSGIKHFVSYTMAFLFRNNIIYYPVDNETLTINKFIFNELYKKIVKCNIIKKEIAYDYCTSLYNMMILSKNTFVRLENRFKKEDYCLTSESDFSDVDKLLNIMKNGLITFNEIENFFKNISNEKLVSFLYSINNIYMLLAINTDDSPNIIANTYMENKLQSSLSIKKHQNLKKKESSFYDENDEDYEDDDDDDEEEDKEEYQFFINTQKSILTNNNNNNINNNNSGGKKNNFFSTSCFINEQNINNLINLSFNTIHYNTCKRKVIYFLLDIKQNLLMFLIFNNLIFSYILKENKIRETNVKVVVCVYFELLDIFCSVLKRYLKKNQLLLQKFNVIKSSSEICHLNILDQVNIEFNDNINESNIDKINICEMHLNANVIKKNLLSMNKKKKEHFINIYIIVRNDVFKKILQNIACSFKITSRKSYKNIIFYYVHFYIHKVNVNLFYDIILKLNKNIKLFEKEEDYNNINDENNDLLMLLWKDRAPIYIIYTSDFEIFHYIKDDIKYLKNITFLFYILHTENNNPIPKNIRESNIFIFYLLRLAKTIAFEKEKIFYINNVIDGPLNNIISVKGLASLSDSKVDDKIYDCGCVTLCTLLNCPIYNGIQDPTTSVLNI
ncbi:hypothetical protein LbFV_ORF5 [Leptopilina boulardi filamentous virus]|uniref:Uncharacterized protein n=1 Tax=Leptopilina boulardi filamentous virus TaxID=552509 RepID=A0A1S5YD55_9VIRU|nr:hypothetical protein LbFV_ORF5 [Leptopilina boulardi filamentous virus]AQQ79925.1 hypothetical protein LbFV_ORF5 [Leptopilina boulardi filamentous virus]